MATKVLIDASRHTGIDDDEHGEPMLGSALVRDPKATTRRHGDARLAKGDSTMNTSFEEGPT